ncbi:MAG: glycosyltransferase [Planctomycetota bacterium]
MPEAKRPISMLLAAPGLVCRRGFGPTEHVLSLASAFGLHEEVSLDLLFGRLEGEAPRGPFRFHVLGERGGRGRSDSLTLGVDPLAYLRHWRELALFLRQHAAYDLAIERLWGFGGFIGRRLSRRGALLIFEENGPLRWRRSIDSPGNALRWIYFHVAHLRLCRVYRRAYRVVVQTEGLARRLEGEFRIPRSMLVVIPNAVEMAVHPREEGSVAEEARRGVRLVYAGSVDRAHDLRPLVEAVVRTRSSGKDLVLHVFGAGEELPALQALAPPPEAVVWHAPVPPDRLAAELLRMDLGVAPYASDLFERQGFEYAPLKVLQYMAADLPVATMPGGPAAGLVEHARNGFLVANTAEAWTRLLGELPPAPRLRAMGQGNATRVEGRSWSAVAAAYLRLYMEQRP